MKKQVRGQMFLDKERVLAEIRELRDTIQAIELPNIEWEQEEYCRQHDLFSCWLHGNKM